MDVVRCFIAIEISPDIGRRLALLQEKLAAKVPARGVRWVKPANIHLTLKFLGDVNADDVDLIGNRLEGIAFNHEPFDLNLGKLGCFPNPRKPRIIWIGVGDSGGPLQDLQNEVDEALDSIGWPKESRRYHPHLTIGRVKDSRQIVSARYPWGEEGVTGEQQVTEICLFRSDLRPSGAVYTIIRKASLGVQQAA